MFPIEKRRMLINDVAVFLAIIFVVYKVVSPVVPLHPNITAAPTVAQQAPAQPAQQQVTAVPAQAQAQAPAPVAATTASNQKAATTTSTSTALPAATSVATLPSVFCTMAVPAGQSPAAAMGDYIENKSAELNAASQQAMTQMQKPVHATIQ